MRELIERLRGLLDSSSVPDRMKVRACQDVLLAMEERVESVLVYSPEGSVVRDLMERL
jgi:hypothetical protein